MSQWGLKRCLKSCRSLGLGTEQQWSKTLLLKYQLKNPIDVNKSFLCAHATSLGMRDHSDIRHPQSELWLHSNTVQKTAMGGLAYWLTGGPNMPRMTVRARPGRAAHGWDRGGRKAWVSGSGGCEGESWCCHSPPFNALPFPLITKHSHFGIYLFWVTTALVTLCITANTPKVTLVRIDVTNKTTQTWLINKQYKTVGLNEDQFCDNEKCANK